MRRVVCNFLNWCNQDIFKPWAELRPVPCLGQPGLQLGCGPQGGVPWGEHGHRACAQFDLDERQRQGQVDSVQPDAGAVHEWAGTCSARAVFQ